MPINLTLKSPAEPAVSPWDAHGAEFRWYTVYGLRLRSRLELSFAPAAPARYFDVELLTAPPGFFAAARQDADVNPTPSGWYKYAQMQNGRSYLRWEGLFEFLVEADGRRIWCGWLGAASLESLQVYLLGHALSFALIKQGYEPLHATSVVIDGGAIAFLGSSGFGKSSLAAAFVAAGHRLLTDDLLLLRRTAAGFEAQPGPPRLKLFPRIAHRILSTTAGAVPMNAMSRKLVLPLDASRYNSRPAPLRAIYVLTAPRQVHKKQRIRLGRLSTRECFIAMVRNTFNHLVGGAERLRRQYSQCLQVASSIPARSISHPRVLAMLPAVREAIVADYMQLPSAENKEPCAATNGKQIDHQ